MTFRRNERKGERGQVLLLCAFSLIVLLLFVGLTIDFGLAYLTKASLGKAVDAAALTGARYIGQGQTTATAIANNAFAMNYGHSNRDANGTPPVEGTLPTPVVTYSKDSLQNTLIQVTATTTINTYFIGLLPAYKTLTVSATAQARYARVQMTLVLDRTGSMSTNAPNNSLQNAVISFINQFDNVNDSVAEISFANDQTLDVSMRTGGFQQLVTNAVNAIKFQGATFSDGALQLASTQEAINLGLTGNIIHVVVFFTDGNANTIQVPLTCTGNNNLQTGTWNVGGYDPPNNNLIGFLSTSNINYNNGSNCPGSHQAAYPLNSNPANACDVQYDNQTNDCNGTFLSTVTGKQTQLSWANVNADALNRAVQDANAMRANNIIVYSIGLHGGAGVLDTSFLCQVANDPCTAYGGNPSYNPNLPVGEFILATDYTGLSAAFQQIANDIHLRLLQ